MNIARTYRKRIVTLMFYGRNSIQRSFPSRYMKVRTEYLIKIEYLWNFIIKRDSPYATLNPSLLSWQCNLKNLISRSCLLIVQFRTDHEFLTDHWRMYSWMMKGDFQLVIYQDRKDFRVTVSVLQDKAPSLNWDIPLKSNPIDKLKSVWIRSMILICRARHHETRWLTWVSFNFWLIFG